MNKKPISGSTDKLLRAEIAELKGLRKDMKLIMRRLDAINENLAPISKKFKDDQEVEELVELIANELH